MRVLESLIEDVRSVCAGLEDRRVGGAQAPFQRLDGRMLIAPDGTEHHCSRKIRCPQCSCRRRSDDRLAFVEGRGTRAPLRLRFNQDVRHTLASEFRKIFAYGGLALELLGYCSGSPVVLAGAVLWWVGCQTLFAILLAMEVE